MKELAQEFFGLFQGLLRAYGKFVLGEVNPDKGNKIEGKASTIMGAVTDSLWQKHLAGKQGLGIVPIRDDASALFGAIDVDCYSLDLVKLEQMISKSPLCLCRTKSGGAHLYLFLEDPLPAEFVRARLTDWAAQLGYPTSEIYPKQNKLANEKDPGSWINMPYFNSKKTDRYCIADGKALSATEFIIYANNKKATKEQLQIPMKGEAAEGDDWLDGPPCLQALTTQGFPEGTRNNGLLNLGVYARLKYGDDWQDKIEEYNHDFMNPPLKMAEIKTLIKSLNKKNYYYTCGKTPVSQFCNKDICRGRRFGIGGNEDEPSVSIGELTKIDSAPPTWILEVEGVRLELSTSDLLNQDKFRLLCMERINVLPNRLKPQVFEKVIKDRLSNVQIVEAPPDAGPEGRFWDLVEQFCTGRAQAKSEDELLRGMPWTHEGMTFFRSRDLMRFLDQQHFREFKERQIWAIFRRDSRVKHGTKNIKGAFVNWWAVPEFQTQKEDFNINEEDM